MTPALPLLARQAIAHAEAIMLASFQATNATIVACNAGTVAPDFMRWMGCWQFGMATHAMSMAMATNACAQEAPRAR